LNDTVGVGCMVGSCKKCEYCTDSLEQFCSSGFLWWCFASKCL
jgi:uncharacterized zinc-type alcohol dehydrogenase-like protein